MKKKIVSLFLAAMMVVSTVPAYAGTTDGGTEGGTEPGITEEPTASATGQCGENLTWKYYDTAEELVISGTGAMYDYTKTNTPWIPAKYSIKTIVFEDDVTGIGENAFAYHTELETVYFSAKMTSIGANAFSKCAALTEVEFPDSLETIGAGAFSGCTDLAEISSFGGVKTIGDSAFEECTSLMTMDEFPDTLATIGAGAFKNCESLPDITLPDSVETVGESAFEGCKSASSLTLSDKLTVIEANTFKGCELLDSVSLPENITAVNESAFENCADIESVDLPDKLAVIKTAAFKNCNKVEAVLPDSLTEVAADAFEEGCLITYHDYTQTSTLIQASELKFETRCPYCGETYTEERVVPVEIELPSAQEETTVDTSGQSTAENPADTSGQEDTENPTDQEEPAEPAVKTTYYVKNHKCGNEACEDVLKVELTDEKGELSGASMALSTTSMIWTGSELKPGVTVYGASEGVTIDPSYYTVSYTNNVKVGTATVTVTINPDQKYAGYTGTLTKTFTILPKVSNATVTLSATSYIWNGSKKTPAVTVTAPSGDKVSASLYKVTYTNNTNVGKATVKVTFDASLQYTGTKTLTFKINPKATTLSTVKAGKKLMTVKWKKQASQTTGYQIQYSRNSKFKSGNKTVTIKKNSTISTTIKKLVTKKKYYVRVRTYRTVSKVNYYSAWSKAKSVTIK